MRLGRTTNMVDVPTTGDMSDAGMTGLKTGGAAAAGEVVGRSILGPGFGTAVGGIGAAAMLGGNARDTAAALSVERGVNEIFAGAAAQGSGGGRGRL